MPDSAVPIFTMPRPRKRPLVFLVGPSKTKVSTRGDKPLFIPHFKSANAIIEKTEYKQSRLCRSGGASIVLRANKGKTELEIIFSKLLRIQRSGFELVG